MIRSTCLVVAFAFGCLNVASAQIDRAVEAHGGLAKWRSFGSVEYDCTFKNAKGTKADHQLFNLHTRDGLITAEKYTLGANRGEVWVKPSLEALEGGTSPRFYMWTPFYFFGMPFVFADPGASHESLGRKTFQGHDYDVTKVTYKAGTGDSPDDYYIAYIDPTSSRLKLSAYIVTFFSAKSGKPVDQLEPHAIVFDEWQEADGLTVPKAARYYAWKNDTIEGEPLGEMSFSNVHFTTGTPEDFKFAKPPDAVVAPKP